jgi:uncharacterized protein (PEP-CTERM system associated)
LAALAAAFAGTVDAQVLRLSPFVGYETTLTDNVNLAPSGQRKSDWVNQITPSLRLYEDGAHSHFSGTISLPIVLYARTSENNYVGPQASVSGTIEAIDKFLFVDATMNVSQQYQSPFGPRPSDLSVATQNRYTAQSYTVSPYIRGFLARDIDYELRNTSAWSVANASFTQNGNNGYSNETVGHMRREPRPWGWALEYDRNDVDFTDAQSQNTEIARGRVIYQPDPSLELSLSAGYESNQFALTEERGPVYGFGVDWRPSPRTTAHARWEHRFFGGSYDVGLAYRTPLTIWGLQASRNITSYPQQIAALGLGGDVSGMLNGLFLGRVPDPLQRQQLVDQVIHQRGLPTVLTSPVAIFTDQLTIVESLLGTVAVIGARNALLFSVFRYHNQPVAGSDLGEVADILTNSIDNTQVGTGVVWTHQLAPDLNLVTNADWSRTESNDIPGDSTRLLTVRAMLSRNLSQRTSIYGGARFQDSHSTVTSSYREAAVLFGLIYEFR